jgi:hypothetical protein
VAWKIFEPLAVVLRIPTDVANAEITATNVCRAVLDRIRADHPKDAFRDDDALLRYYPDDAVAILNQKHLIAAELALELPAGWPSWGQIMMAISSLASRRGRSSVGIGRLARCHLAYEDAMAALRRLVRRGATYEGSLRRELLGLRRRETGAGRQIIAILEKSWIGRRLSWQAIALDYASRAVTPHLSSEVVRKALPRLRRLRDAFEARRTT